jgi:DNA-binding NtrC family response regulator
MSPLTSVLIVDDEPAMRDLMSRWVSSLGLLPKTVATADEALLTLRDGHYDLAVIDVMMPGHDGLWLADQLKRDHPNTAVVIATAHTDLLGEKSQQRPIADVLIKPFLRERFALAVDRGRQWRKEALSEIRWHEALSLELRQRTERIIALVHERAVGETSEAQVLADCALQRMPDPAAHGARVVRYAESGARELGVDYEMGGFSNPPPGSTTSGAGREPSTRC